MIWVIRNEKIGIVNPFAKHANDPISKNTHSGLFIDNSLNNIDKRFDDDSLF